jgi:phosphate transport system permease protein
MDAIETAPPPPDAESRRRRSPEIPPESPPAAPSDSGPRPESVYTSRHLNLGRPWIWSSATGVVLIVLMLAGLLWITLSEGLGQFWPASLHELRLKDGRSLLGEVRAEGESRAPDAGPRTARRLIRVGHREVTGSQDFVWVDTPDVSVEFLPEDAWTIERVEYGHLFGRLGAVRGAEGIEQALEKGAALRRRLEAVRRRMNAERDAAELAKLEKSRVEIEREGTAIEIEWRLADGSTAKTPAIRVVHAFQPNRMGFLSKIGHYVSRLWEFFTESPRESNTEGGIWPVITGTIFLVVVMTLAAVPMGVIAALYLHEYAKDGPLLRLVRLGMANLAGVPSIVFGIFGLGLFVYTIGGGFDAAFFPGRGGPTFGTGGVLWGALTLALLTVPVVIVAAGEGLRTVPRAYRDGALALGATRWQTIRHVVLPQALPGILTGAILAIGRGAGEVAPLMVLGAAVKLAPQPIVDGSFPFFHLERKFLHLGFHIYDVSMQSPNVEAAKPMTYASTLALVLLVLGLNLAAILLRNRLRKRFKGAAL